MEGLIFRYIYDTAQRLVCGHRAAVRGCWRLTSTTRTFFCSKGGDFEVAEEADKKWKQQRREVRTLQHQHITATHMLAMILPKHPMGF